MTTHALPARQATPNSLSDPRAGAVLGHGGWHPHQCNRYCSQTAYEPDEDDNEDENYAIDLKQIPALDMCWPTTTSSLAPSSPLSISRNLGLQSLTTCAMAERRSRQRSLEPGISHEAISSLGSIISFDDWNDDWATAFFGEDVAATHALGNQPYAESKRKGLPSALKGHTARQNPQAQRRRRVARGGPMRERLWTLEVTTEEVTITSEEGIMTADDNTVTSGETTSTAEEAVTTTGDTAVTSNGTQASVEQTMVTPETTTSGAAQERDQHTKPPSVKTNVLPEHYLLRGHFFAREAEPHGISLAGSTGDAAVVVTCLPAPKATPAAVQRDPPLFPENWFDNGKYDPEERRVRLQYVQDAKSCDDRSFQIVHLVIAQLMGVFFTSETDEDGRLWISVPKAPFVPRPNPNMKMPEAVGGAGGAKFVYIHPSFHQAEIKRKERRREEARQKEEERKREKERQNKKKEQAKATTDVAAAVDEKAEGDAEERPTQSEGPISHVDAEEASEVVSIETTLPSQSVDHPQDMKGNDAGLDAAAAPADDQAANPQASVQLTKDALDMFPGVKNTRKAIKQWLPREEDEEEDEDEDDWTHVSDESHEAVAPSAPTTQADGMSVVSWLFGW